MIDLNGKRALPNHAPIWTQLGVEALGLPTMRSRFASPQSFIEHLRGGAELEALVQPRFYFGKGM